ncbi:hypothetical protein VKT23_011885 [Stygiomarasmius scandens]|uniref:O-methyltransferase C-terminal domain-containing protein n=1 Tax=Marasmiellus scandens TaxID=2682957 RepID=A0ABR1J7Q5_9AGAR
MHSGLSDITKLAELISQSVSTVCAEYTSAGKVLPPLDSTESGSFDAPEKTNEVLQAAIKTIEAACAQLSVAVANPGHVITNKTYNYFETACLRIVMDAKIADLLLNRPEGVHVGELGQKSNRDPGKLSRVLRALATNHVFMEGLPLSYPSTESFYHSCLLVKPDVFANNRLSIKLISTDPLSALVDHMSNEAMKCGAVLGDVVADPKTAFSTKIEDTAHQKAHGMSLFEMMASDTIRGECFNRAMVGWAQVTGRAMIPRIYPWGDLPKDTTIVDVGGGNGHAVLDIVKVFPQVKVVIQDAEAVILDGQKYWQKEHPEAISKERVAFKAFDFFKDPPVAGCDIYYLRHVLHDWPTDMAIAILSNVRKVVQPKSKLLIHEFVPQHIVRDATTKVFTLEQQHSVLG